MNVDGHRAVLSRCKALANNAVFDRAGPQVGYHQYEEAEI